MGVFKKICLLSGSKWLFLAWLLRWMGNEWLVRTVVGGRSVEGCLSLDFMVTEQQGSPGGVGSQGFPRLSFSDSPVRTPTVTMSS